MKINQLNEDLRAEFMALNQQWDAAFNAQQPSLVASFYDDEATVMPAGKPQVSCGKAILDFFRAMIAQGVIEHKIELLEIETDNNYAFQRGLWSAAMLNARGERQEFNGNLFLLYRRQQQGGWKIFTHIWN